MEKNKNLEILKELEPLVGGNIVSLTLTQGMENEAQYHGLRIKMPDGTIRDLILVNAEKFSSENSFSILEIPASALKNSRSLPLQA